MILNFTSTHYFVLRFEFNTTIQPSWLDRSYITCFCFIGIDYYFSFLWYNRQTRAYVASMLKRSLHTHARSCYQRNTHRTNIHALSEIWTRDPSHQEPADLRLRPQGHRDQPVLLNSVIITPNRFGTFANLLYLDLEWQELLLLPSTHRTWHFCRPARQTVFSTVL
jgi:hypothetical protein